MEKDLFDENQPLVFSFENMITSLSWLFNFVLFRNEPKDFDSFLINY